MGCVDVGRRYLSKKGDLAHNWVRRCVGSRAQREKLQVRGCSSWSRACSVRVRCLWLAVVSAVLFLAPVGVTGVASGRARSASVGLLATATGPTVSVKETSSDQSFQLTSLPDLQFSSGGGGSPTTITVNDAVAYQPIAGFGATMTDVSAHELMTGVSASARQSALTDLFDPVSGIGLDYVRIPIGGNDFSEADYSQGPSPSNNYTEDDNPPGDDDP
jgi:hypothetical protein